MKTRATAKIKIQATPEIIETLRIYSRGLQFCVDEAWERGIEVVRSKPHYTSQLCHRCGILGSRSSGSFACLHCGLNKYSADLNAARNLAHPMLVERQAAITQPNVPNCDASILKLSSGISS